MVHRSINSQLFLLTLKVVISTLVLISAVYSTYFMIFYDWHSPPAFSWIRDSLMTILSVLLSSVLASYLSLSFAKDLLNHYSQWLTAPEKSLKASLANE